MTAAEIFDLSGRTAVLTGATGFLGAPLPRRFCKMAVV